MPNTAYHVVTNPDGGWVVRKEGTERALKRFLTKVAAVTYARFKCREKRADLVVHRSDGTITEKNSYSIDPRFFPVLESLEGGPPSLPGPWTTREKELIKLYLEGYKCEEIADKLNEDARLVRVDLNAAKSKLHQRIKRGPK